MEKLTKQMSTYVKEQRLKYMVNENGTRYILPYSYTVENGKKYRVSIFVNLDDEKQELEVGFNSELLDTIDKSEAMAQMLSINNKLKQGVLSLAGTNEGEVQFFIRSVMEREKNILSDIYDVSVGYCIGVHEYLIKKGIIQYESKKV